MIIYFLEIENNLKGLEDFVVDYSSNISKSRVSFLLSVLLFENRVQRVTDDEDEYNDLIDCINDLNTLLITEKVNDGEPAIKIINSDFEKIKVSDNNDMSISQEEIEEIQKQIKENF